VVEMWSLEFWKFIFQTCFCRWGDAPPEKMRPNEVANLFFVVLTPAILEVDSRKLSELTDRFG